MELVLVTQARRVAKGFQRWMEALENVSVDYEGYWELQGERIRFRPLPGLGRTEFWVGQNAHTAVQINLPKDPRTENGASALAVDVNGNEYIVRQGVLHENGASTRIEPDVFSARTGLQPLPATIGDSNAARAWFVVTVLTGMDDSAVAASTASFVHQCWIARGQVIGGETGGGASLSSKVTSGDERERTESGEHNSLPSGRVWVTSFWGFNPEGEGYLGFTREGDRVRFLKQWQPGDLVMIYGTMGESTDEPDRGRVMGFLEVEPRMIRDTDRMSLEGRQWKVENRVADRWTYALPVVRAWRAVDLPQVRAIAPTTLGRAANWQLIASRGVPLLPEEAEAALAIRVRPVDVYGQAALPPEETEKVYVPSRGFPMSFGTRTSETTDDVHVLYALQLVGDPSVIMGEPPHQTRGKIIVKVGLAKDPNNRCSQHNACLPPAAKMRWKVLLRSSPLPDGESALKSETALKDSFARTFRSLGGEFFLCDEKTLASEFAKAGPYPGSGGCRAA